jgi:predicted GNAT superfamily acetyltransferase
MNPMDIEIAEATTADLDGILELQARNQPDRGGTLSHRFPRDRMAAMVKAMPVIVARHGGRVIGYLVSAPLSLNADVPVLQAMLAVYRGAPDAYVYGPICVDADERGQGLSRAMFAALRKRLPGREGILFVRHDNAASLNAHAKMGMRTVATFTHGGVAYDVLSYIG